MLSPQRRGSAKACTDFPEVGRGWALSLLQGPRLLLSLPWSTHYSVGWRCAPDKALDLALLSVEGMLGLGAGDDGGSC